MNQSDHHRFGLKEFSCMEENLCILNIERYAREKENKVEKVGMLEWNVEVQIAKLEVGFFLL